MGLGGCQNREGYGGVVGWGAEAGVSACWCTGWLRCWGAGGGESRRPSASAQHIPQQEGACAGLEKRLSEGTGGCRDTAGDELAHCCPGFASAQQVRLGLVLGANSAAWSQTGPRGAVCLTLSPSPGTGPGEPRSRRLLTPEPPQSRIPQPSWPAVGDRTVTDCSTYPSAPGRKGQVPQGSVCCRQQAGQDHGLAGERVPDF